jgi:hypothetical protein
MTVSISNTNLSDSFNTWRLNTNYAATVLSNNVVTVTRAGSAERGGVAVGNGHIKGTFSADELRTPTLKAGNTSNDGAWLVVGSNTFVNATTLSVTANAIFQGNTTFDTAGTDRLTLGDISRIRMTGGNAGEFLKKIGTDTIDFAGLTLRDIADLSTNSAHIILSGSNTTFSDNNDSPALILTNGTDRAFLYMASDPTIGDSDVYLKLVDATGDSRFAVTDSGNTVVAYIDSDGNVVSASKFLPSADDTVDLGSSSAEFKDLYLDGVAYIDELSVATGASQGVSTSLIPKTDAAGNLGSSTRKWGTVWADTTNGGAGVFNTLGVSTSINSNGTLTIAAGGSLVVTGNVASDIVPNTVDGTGHYDLGSSSQRFQFVYANNVLANNIVTDNDVTIKGNLVIEGSTTLAANQAFTVPEASFSNLVVSLLAEFNGDVDIGDADTDTVTFNAKVDSSIVPSADATYNLGSSSEGWNNAYIDGSIINDGTVIVGKNGKLHANNTITSNTITNGMLANTINVSNTYGVLAGGSDKIPVIRVNKEGRIIGISNTSVAGVSGLTYTDANNTFTIATAAGSNFSANIAVAEHTTSSTDGSKKGVSSFNSNQFDVANGYVSLAGGSSGAITKVTGTANKIEITRDGANAYFTLPTDVSVDGQLNVGENLVVTGNLIVSGTTTTVNTEEVNLADNIINLNSNHSGAPSQNGGISVNRGSSANVTFIWDETADKWTVGSETIVAGTFEGDITGNITGNADTATALANTVQFSITGDVVMGDGVSNPTFDGSDGVQLDVRISNTSPSIIRVYDVNDTQVFP